MITAKLVPKRSILTSALYVLIILLACDTTYTMEPPQKPLPHDVVKKLQSFFNKPIGQAFGLHGYNDLMFALIVGNEQEARRIIERDPAQIRGRTNIGLTPLHFAAVFSSVALIEYLIDHGGDVLINDDISVDDESSHVDWDSPLDCAITRRNPEPALYLISRGANVDQECLLRAIARGNIATVYHLLHHGVVWDDDADFDSSLEKISDVQLRNEMKRLLSMFGVACISEVSIVDPLQRAARCGQSAEVEKLLSGAWYIPQFIHNYFMYPPDQLGRALAYSVCRHPHISRLLLHAGAKLHDVEPVVEAYNQRQITKRKDHAEFESQNRGSQVSEIQDLIREQKRALKAQDLELYRATQHVIQTRDNELFSSLSECQKRGPATCFHRLPPHILRTVLAYKNGRLWGAQHNNPERITAQQELVTAIKESDLQSVRLLLSQGANPNARCQLTHEPLLHVAFCADNYSELIELLLDHGAYPNPELNNGILIYSFLDVRYSPCQE